MEHLWDVHIFWIQTLGVCLRRIFVFTHDRSPCEFWWDPNKGTLTSTLQGINISHLGKRKIIFKMPCLGGYVSSLEGNKPGCSLGHKQGQQVKHIHGNLTVLCPLVTSPPPPRNKALLKVYEQPWILNNSIMGPLFSWEAVVFWGAGVRLDYIQMFFHVPVDHRGPCCLSAEADHSFLNKSNWATKKTWHSILLGV